MSSGAALMSDLAENLSTKPESFELQERKRQALYFSQHAPTKVGFANSPYRLHPEARTWNLAPSIRHSVDPYFEQHGIVWHQHANHGLSSQVCCLNFLLPLAE